MGVSKNSGTPKSSILIGISIISHPFWEYHHLRKHPYTCTNNDIHRWNIDIHTYCYILHLHTYCTLAFLFGGDFLGSNIIRLRSIHKYASIRKVLHKGLFCCSSHLRFLFEEVLRWSGIDIAFWQAVSWTGKFLNPFDLFESNVSLQVRSVCGFQDLMRQPGSSWLEHCILPAQNLSQQSRTG